MKASFHKDQRGLLTYLKIKALINRDRPAHPLSLVYKKPYSFPKAESRPFTSHPWAGKMLIPNLFHVRKRMLSFLELTPGQLMPWFLDHCRRQGQCYRCPRDTPSCWQAVLHHHSWPHPHSGIQQVQWPSEALLEGGIKFHPFHSGNIGEDGMRRLLSNWRRSWPGLLARRRMMPSDTSSRDWDGGEHTSSYQYQSNEIFRTWMAGQGKTSPHFFNLSTSP